MTTRAVLAALIALGAFSLAGGPVYAHAFGQRYDLPIPLSYFMAGAAATVALSFVVIGLFLRGGSAEYRYPRFNLLSLPGATLSSRIKIFVAQVLSVLLFLLVLATSFLGSDNPLENFSPTFVWIIWWVGMGYIAALFGNFWMLINPWKSLFELAEWGFKRIGADLPAPRPYPTGWDAMPALIAFLCLRLAGERVSRLHRATIPWHHHHRVFALHAGRHAAVRQACVAALWRPVRDAVRHIRALLADGGTRGWWRM